LTLTVLTLISVVICPNTTGFKLHLSRCRNIWIGLKQVIRIRRGRIQLLPARTQTGINQLGWTWTSRSSAGNQILREIYLRRHPIRADDALLTAISSGLYADRSPAYDAEELEQTYDGLNDSVSSDLRTQRRINRFDGNIIR